MRFFRRETTLFALLAFAGAAHASEKQSAAPSTEPISFRGYYFLRAKPYVSLQREEQHQWVEVGGVFFGYTVLSLDSEGKTVTLRDRNGLESKLGVSSLPATNLHGPKKVSASFAERFARPLGLGKGEIRPTEIIEVFPSQDTPRKVADLNWEWIRSEKNPMREKAALPMGLEAAAWAEMNNQQKTDLVELFRQHGWALTGVITNKGIDFHAIRLTPEGITKSTLKIQTK